MHRRQMVGFLTLCLWSSAGWLIDEALPFPESTVAGQGTFFFLVGVLALATLWLRASGSAPSFARIAMVGAVSVGLLGVPMRLLTAVQGHVASTTVALTFALMPILLMVADAMDLRLLAYGLMGVAGLMLLLPTRLPSGSSGAVAVGLVLAAMVLAACSMVWMHRLLEGFPLRIALGAVGIGNGIFLTVTGASEMNRWSVRLAEMEAMRGLLVDLPETILLIWLVKAVSPLKLSTRYLVAPLLTVVEGLALIRPKFEVRMMVGLALLGVGAYRMLAFERRAEETSLELG